MKKPLIILAFLSYGCTQTTDHSKNESARIDSLKKAVIKTEIAFNKMASNFGVKRAFLEFAADSAVIVRGPGIIKGKPAIEEYFNDQTLKEVKLQWKPEFVDVAASGDLAYTYGPYTFTAVDSTGKQLSSQGTFHTVWKKQADGKWKFVYD